MSGSLVMPEGSKRMFTNFETKASSGTPYCSPSETAMAKASMMPESVEPCLDTLRKISPIPSSGYSPAVMYPSASPTMKETVRAGRLAGSRRRTGLPGSSTSGLAVTAFFLSAESGWATLQLSR